MRDVAEAADVSIMSVSRVVNNQRGVGAKTKARVREAMRDLGFISGVNLASRDTPRQGFLRAFHGLPPFSAGRAWTVHDVPPDFQTEAFHEQGPRHFFECARIGAAPVAGVADGRGAVELILAAYESDRTGRRVDRTGA